MSRFASLLLLLPIAAFTASTTSHAQPNPEFKFEEKPKEEVKKVEWSAEALGGMIITTGNSQTTTVSAGGKASRKEGCNKLAIAAAIAYARSSILVAQDANGNGVIDGSGTNVDDSAEVTRETQTTAQAWLVTARYDRFLSKVDSLFALGKVGADAPAGKDLYGGGQLGYARLLLKDETHALSGEAGYDFTYERLDNDESSSIHSARVFAGYAGKLSGDTGVTADIEALFNLNEVTNGRPEPAGAFEDTRVNGNLSLTTKLFSNISFRFGFGFKWDNYAAPAPKIGGIPFADGFVPVADELDTKTEASHIVNFL